MRTTDTQLARSSDQLLQLDNAAGINNGEYLVMGHDSASLSTYSNTELPMSINDYVRRVDREWLVEEAGETGQLRLMVDTTKLPTQPIGFRKLFCHCGQ